MLDYFTYDISSPSGLFWSEDAKPYSKKSTERQPFTVAGSLSKGIWHVQVTDEDGARLRTTAHRVIWELHYGAIPDNHVIIHRNTDTSDNRIENLAMASRSMHNHIKAWHRGVFNVRPTGSGRWFATIRNHKSLGTYDTYEEAASVYREELYNLVKSYL